MGKHGGKSKKSDGDKSGESILNSTKAIANIPKTYDKDTAVFILMSRELKDEGNGLFQKRDYEGAMLKYEKALKLLPRNHIDVSYLRSNMAACYMQLGISEYPRAIHECNLALEVTPKYGKALLKRARCYEALNRLDLALRDVGTVLKMEPNNLMAIEIEERVRNAMDNRGSRDDEIIPLDLVPLPEFFEPPQTKAPKEKKGKMKSKKQEEKRKEVVEKEMKRDDEERKVDIDVVIRKTEENQIDERKTEDKLVVEEEKIIMNGIEEEEPRRTVKLVFGEDIRWAKVPLNCDILKLREIVNDRFPIINTALIKYRDEEGDLITITTTEELRLAEASTDHGTVKLHIVEVNPNQDPFSIKGGNEENLGKKNIHENGHVGKRNESACISDWIIEFAHLFKNHVGFDIDSYLDLHDMGMKLYADAMEDTVTSEEAQDLFSIAADKFQEMAALALFNWGNVHMARARKRVYLGDDSSQESVLIKVKSAYEWAQMEYTKAGKRYEEALKINLNFYEAVLALGQQQFEQGKISWYYAVGNNVDLESWDSTETLQLYNKAEENMEKGMQMWEEAEEQRLGELTQKKKMENLLKKMKVDSLLKRMEGDEGAEQAAGIRSQINVLWGTMLYERSIMEFKLGLPVWHECLEVAVEKFELAGASSTDIAVMIKNHCSNDTALEGLGFNIDEIVQAWNEMYEAKKWQSSISSFRLEPLLRRRVSKLCYVLEHA